MAIETFAAPTQAELDALTAKFNNPVTVPDRNLANITTSTNSTDISSVTNVPSSSTQLEVIQPSGSNFSSTQLPAGTGAEVSSTGIAAASTNSTVASQNFTNLANTQLGLANVTVAEPTGAASPVTAATLQSATSVLNNGFLSSSNLGTNLFNPSNQPNNGADQFDRVKLRYRSGHPMAMYPNMLQPLSKTSGLVWLYKPAVQVQMNVDYETLSLTHSIQEIHAFSSNRAAQISISGQFVSQNVDEAMYALAAIHFMRAVSKMSFGTEVANNTTGTPIGSPPPVLLLSGYGTMMMNDIPVIVTNFSLDLPADVDYIEIPSGPGYGTKIPVSFNLSANLVVQQAPQDMRAFNVDTYTKTGIRGWW